MVDSTVHWASVVLFVFFFARLKFRNLKMTEIFKETDLDCDWLVVEDVIVEIETISRRLDILECDEPVALGLLLIILSRKGQNNFQ